MELLIGNEYTNGWLYDRLNRFNRLFNEAGIEPQTSLLPPTDIVEHADGYHFSFEMPGIKADSVDVRVEDGRLVIEAQRKPLERPKDAQVHLSERSYGTMRRSFAMPEDASEDGIKATYRDGVLEVAVAKKPEAKPTRIKVNVEN
jgi:HSP20 family protein